MTTTSAQILSPLAHLVLVGGMEHIETSWEYTYIKQGMSRTGPRNELCLDRHGTYTLHLHNF